MPTNPRLPHTLNTRLTHDQWAYLEATADGRDLTMSGAIRAVLDDLLDAPVNDQPSAPSRRQLMREELGEVVSPGGGRMKLVSASRASS
jgi:hypothetical protein